MKRSTREWAAKAEEDYLAAVDLARRRKQPLWSGVCFHAQQCAEKYLKARLEEANLAIPRTHDLENLLNTKWLVAEPPGAFRNLRESLWLYGLRDFSADNPKAPAVRQQLRREIERTISRFEPRLRSVSVQLDAESEKERTLRFRISAMLIVEPLSEPVTFDTVLDVNRAQFKVTG